MIKQQIGWKPSQLRVEKRAHIIFSLKKHQKVLVFLTLSSILKL